MDRPLISSARTNLLCEFQAAAYSSQARAIKREREREGEDNQDYNNTLVHAPRGPRSEILDIAPPSGAEVQIRRERVGLALRQLGHRTLLRGRPLRRAGATEDEGWRGGGFAGGGGGVGGAGASRGKRDGARGGLRCRRGAHNGRRITASCGCPRGRRDRFGFGLGRRRRCGRSGRRRRRDDGEFVELRQGELERVVAVVEERVKVVDGCHGR